MSRKEQLNPRQREIVERLDEPLFVAAGAGSGKTFTLTKRIVHALEEGSGADGGRYLDDLSQVLVITFTEAAARDIKERTRSALRSAGPAYRDFVLQVDSAWISTIHGMCSRILHRHALDLGLDPEFRVASTNEETLLRRQALEDVVGRARSDAAAGTPLARAFAEYGYGAAGERGYTGVLGIVDSIARVAGKAQGGFDGLDLGPEPDVRGAMERLATALEEYAPQIVPKTAAAKRSRQDVDEALRVLAEFRRLAPGAQTADAAWDALSRVRLPRSGAKAAKEFLDRAKLALNEAKGEVKLAEARPEAVALCGLARKADARYRELKLAQSLLDNDDLVSQALAAMERDDIRAQYDGRFRLVMVDEFQDTDQRQLRLIGMLAGEGARHLCTVGDAQQSIYRFRGADVSVFRGRGAELPEASRIQMAVNYRSDDAVLRLVDRVCDASDGGVLRGFMSLATGRKSDSDPYAAAGVERVSVELVEGGGADTRSAVMAAAIAERLGAYEEVCGGAGNMALLLGATKRADLYIDALRERGLDCVVTGGSTFTGLTEVKVMGALLHTLANWGDTKNGLFPLLESPMFGLDADDLVQLGTGRSRKYDGPERRTLDEGLADLEAWGASQPSERVRRAAEVLVEARGLLSTRPVADVCVWVVRQSGWLGRLERQGVAGRAQEANVVAALGYIRELTEDLGLGPTRAAHEFDIWLQRAKVAPATLSGGGGGAVSIMTVHASKGLEFPVVAVAECWSDPPDGDSVKEGRCPGRGKDGLRTLVLEPKSWKEEGRKSEVGISTCWTNAKKLRSGLGEDPVPDGPQTLFDWDGTLRETKREEEYEEKTRLLYVALTRAEEALVIGLPAGRRAGALADATLEALFRGDVPPVGESTFAFAARQDGSGGAGGAPHRAHVRHVALVGHKDGAANEVEVDSGGTLQMGDGTHPDVPAELCVLGARRRGSAGAAEADEPAETGGAVCHHAPDGEPEAGAADGRDGTGAATDGFEAGVADDEPDTCAADGKPKKTGVGAPFLLFERPDEGLAGRTALWSPRDGVYSYSSAHQQLLDSFARSREAGAQPLAAEGGPGAQVRASVPSAQALADGATRADGSIPPAEAARDADPQAWDDHSASARLRGSVPAAAEEEGEGTAPVADDADKATNLGSAFHELAQGMVETGSFPSEDRVERTSRLWHLSARARARLERALRRWWGSDLRREVLDHSLVRAEVPFFCAATSAYGDHVEGAIDLLATDGDGGEAFLVDYKTGDAGLGIEQIRERHAMQANFYARVLMDWGFASVTCSFVCVEREDDAGQPLVVRYRFDADHAPLL